MTPGKKRLLLVTVALLLGIVGVVSGMTLMLIHAAGFDAVARAWASARATIQALKWAAMIMVVWRWPAIAAWATERFDLSEEEGREMRAARWRLATALVALELVLGQNLLGMLAGH